MTQRMRWVVVLACVAVCCMPKVGRAGGTLKPFASEAQFQQQLSSWREQADRETRAAQRAAQRRAKLTAASPAATLDQVVVTGSLITEQDIASITNVQTAGVDEGDIVKRAGDYLLVLRRGRIFSIRIANDQLEPVDHVNAFAPDADPARTWYDEMLVSGRTVVVIGYSYERGGTEIGVFDLEADGRLRYRATYQMRSNDYYSSRNYASRLIGNKLIFYTPLAIRIGEDASSWLPAVRHWHRGVTPADFHRILPATRIYRAAGEMRWGDLALHSVTTCDLTTPTLDCESTAVLGPTGRVFYVSEDSVFVWTTSRDAGRHASEGSSVVRLPLDGSAPAALRTSGSPVDQMAFLQRDGYLNVLVGNDAGGDAMWRSDSRAGALALLRVRLDRFGDGTDTAGPGDYRPLPNLDGSQWDLQNRFIGDWLVYGIGYVRNGGASIAGAVRYASDAPAQLLRLAHPVERIDALGRDAILVGSAGPDLHFTSVRLGERAEAVAGFVQQNAAQDDDRTHGFFYKPFGDGEGIIGLPTTRFESDGDEARSSEVLFLHNHRLQLSRAGSLQSLLAPNADDDCQVSCVDWYGNARPIFLGDRVFALLGYEIVEGRMNGERIAERRRANFDPSTASGPSARAAK
jgi:hypothetical protein